MKKKIVIGALAAFIIFVLIGGFAMMKKVVKQDSFDLQGINTITLRANAADVNIQLTDEDKMTVTQYSKKKTDEDFSFITKTDNSALTIADNGKEVSLLFGIKGTAGISYELKIPKTYEQNICIRLNCGNTEYSGTSNHKFKAVDVAVAKRGDIKLASLSLLENSSIFTGGGNVDVHLVPGADLTVIGQSLSGNVTIAEQFKNGKPTLTIKSNQGNITVK
ncbi:MAG: DUF4097 family beta strand repeat-containing protein [Christensenella sp.]